MTTLSGRAKPHRQDAGATRIRGLTPPARLLLALLAVLSAGCLNSHNPSYFPYYFPGGRIQQEHAKPSFGYLRDFDPKACRLDLAPGDTTAPVGSAVVFVATVSDKDGQPRRSRRVEWLLDGPGHIVEADETGFYAGRGYKVDNKYAVSYTSYKGGTITRGNADPGDDVTFTPGQTFCVVSSAVPGETTLTAYAPGVFDWEKGRVVAKIVWGGGRFKFPDPAVARTGGEHTLTTAVTGQDGDAAGYRVRYKVLDDGPPAVLVGKSGVSQSGTAAREAEAPVDAAGEAAVRLVQPEARTGKTRVLVEVVKPPDAGNKTEKVVGRRETVVEWASPALKLDVTAPPAAAPNAPYPAAVVLANTGAVDGSRAAVRVTLSDGATLDWSDPPPRLDGSALVFQLDPVTAGKRQEVALKVRPAKDYRGPVRVTATAETADGLRTAADASARTQIEVGKLAVTVETPPAAVTGGRVPVRLAVTNPGPLPAAHATVFARFDAPLKHPDDKGDVEFAAGTLAPGQTKTFDLPLTATTAGRFEVRGTATADGGLSASAAGTVEVRAAGLTATVAGPKLAYVGQEFTWTATVTNTGAVPATNLLVRAAIPPEVRLTDAGGGRAGSGADGGGSMAWRVDTLGPGERKTVTLTLEGAKLADRAALTVAAVADVAGGDGVEAKAEAAVAVIGTPAVVLELAAPPGLVEVGKRATVRVRVKNPGTVAARDVTLTALVPAEFKVIRGTGPADAAVDATGKVMFPAVGEVRPGEAVTFAVELEAAKAGDARLRVEVGAAHLRNPLKEEQAVRVVGR